MLPEDDRPPAWLRDTVSIDVQVEGLRSFATALLEDLEKNFGTHLPQVYDVMTKHACVGQDMVFAEMNAVVQKHYDCLTAIVNLLRDYASGTYAMGKGAEVVATNYETADGTVRATATQVEQVMKPNTSGPTVEAMESNVSSVSLSDGGLVDRGVS
ncbi:hypothetical protein HC031_11515 [Planosporangium thailandense]|uniref:Uncharacterized protein n=1 Tax=Planosporangium thailandense TaxID=765197 RepID=A0ABX0XWA9_9ACTN|nr:hypothetical protein [Planosporangium thailandense]NJC70334.1 hypothetical protein [Planosporangium thailandense]